MLLDRYPGTSSTTSGERSPPAWQVPYMVIATDCERSREFNSLAKKFRKIPSARRNPQGTRGTLEPNQTTPQQPRQHLTNFKIGELPETSSALARPRARKNEKSFPLAQIFNLGWARTIRDHTSPNLLTQVCTNTIFLTSPSPNFSYRVLRLYFIK